MADSDLDYAKVTGRFGITVGDDNDVDELPEIIYCTSGSIELYPLQSPVKVVGADPVPLTLGNAVIVATINADGYLEYRGVPRVWVVDLTSEKVNPRIGDGAATHEVRFVDMVAGDTAVTFPGGPVRITAAGPNGDGINDLTTLLPVLPGAAEPIYQGPPGVSVESASIEGGDLVLALDDGTEVNAGELPVGPGGSDAGVAGYIDAPGSATKTALSATFVRRTSVLAPWHSVLRETPSVAKIALIGDSTYDVNANGFQLHAAIKRRIYSGGPLSGMTEPGILNFGYNGQTTENITSDAHMADLTAAAPHLWIAGPGINNMRTRVLTDRATDVAWLRAILVTGFNKIRAAVPGVPGIASIPNSFITTDVGGTGYVTNGNPQECSAVMREAYLSLADEWPDVIVDDTQEYVFGTTSLATSPYMTDQIHPSSAGADAKAAHLISIIGYTQAPATGRSVAAVAASPYTPWTAYFRDVEDTGRYALVGEYNYQNQGATFLDFDCPSGQRSIFKRGDIVQIAPGGVAFQIPMTGTFTANANGAFTRLLFASGVIPANTVNPARGKVRVFRQIYGQDTAVEDVIRDTTWQFKRYFRVTAGSGTSLTLTPASNSAAPATQPATDLAQIIASGDKVYVEGNGVTPITLTGAPTASSGNLVLSGLTGTDYSTYVGRLAVIVGTHSAVVPVPGVAGPAGKTGNATVSGRDILPTGYGAQTSATATNGTEYAVPFVFQEDATITHIAIESTGTVAGAVARLGIRTSTGNTPDALAQAGVADYGTVDCSTTGIKVITLPTPLAVTAGTLMWAVVRVAGTAAPAMKTLTGPNPYVSMRGGVANELGTASYAATRTTADAALVANFGATLVPSNYAPMVRLRVA